jgi:hypothetical protein
MYLSDLIDVLLDIEENYGNQNVFLTTEKECHLYNSCEIAVMTHLENPIIKIEGNGTNEILPIPNEDSKDE